MKTNTVRVLFILSAVCLWKAEAFCNGCTASQFTLTYSPICGCFQFCGGAGNTLLISDCQTFNYIVIDWGDNSPAYNLPLINGSIVPETDLPCHNYPPGRYIATLTIDGNCHGGWDPFGEDENHCEISQEVIVDNAPLVFDAVFTAEPVCLGLTTVFQNYSTFASNLVNQTYFWDFGDGTTSTDEFPLHEYSQCGAYDVKLIISAQTLCCPGTAYDTLVRRVYVNCPPNSPSNALGLTDPYIYESTASVSMNEVCLGDVTNVFLTKSDSIVSWRYTFGDGSSSTLLNPSITFPHCPPFVPAVNVFLTTTRGCTGLLMDTAIVSCPVAVNYSGVTGVLCAGDCNGTATINITSGTAPYTIRWEDGQTTTTAINLCEGSYTVTVNDSKGCEDSLTLDVFSPQPFTGSVTTEDIQCYGWLTGTAVLTVAGGTPPNTYFWNPGGDTTAIVSALPPGTYCVTASDANGCSLTDCGTISQPAQLNATFSVNNTPCGECTGSAIATASGGIPPGNYNFEWTTNPVQNTASATGLCSGIYYLRVEDANAPGCRLQFPVTIGNIGSEPVTLTKTNISCSGSCDGTATATPATCGNCVFEWLTASGTVVGGNTSTITGLCAGNYISRVTNPTNGCQNLQNFTIIALNPVTAATTSTGITCVGQCDGQITVVPGGGTGVYTYEWFDANNAPLPGNSTTLSALCPGTYYVEVTDQNGCTARDSAIVDGHFFTGNRTNTIISCNGDCNASITATATGSNPPFTFAIRNSAGISVNNGAIAANLCPDTYSIVVTDTRGCTLTLPPVAITQPTAIVPVTSATAAECFGDCNGSVSVTNATAGGIPPYAYQWADSLFVPIPGATNATLSNICPGRYYVLVTDANNCIAPWTLATVLQPSPLQDSMTIIQPYCGNNGIGCVDLTAHGGTPPYSYVWSHGVLSDDFCDVEGQYSVIIEDANDCVIADVADLISLPPLTVVAVSKIKWREANLPTSVDIRCHGGRTGIAIVEVTGGNPDYTYRWNDPAGTVHTHGETVDTIRGLAAGTYNVTITDSSGCFTDTFITITEPPPLMMIPTVTHNLCFGDTLGSISLAVTGGLPISPVALPEGYYARWTYLSDSSVNIPTLDLQITGLAAGDYSVVVLDSNQCDARDTITITEPPPLVTDPIILNVTCADSSDGSITLNVTGGTPFTASPPYNYSWTWNGGNSSSKDLSDLAPGTFYVHVTDSNNCSAYDTAIVTQPLPLADTIFPHQPICYGHSNGYVDYTVSGGSGPYSYLWSNGDTTQNLTGIPAGGYSVTATDIAGCTITSPVNVNQPLPITGPTVPINICRKDSLLIDGVYVKTEGLYPSTLKTSLGCDSVIQIDLSLVDSFEISYPVIECHYDLPITVAGETLDREGDYRIRLTAAGGCDSIVAVNLSVYPDINLHADPPIDTFDFGADESVRVTILNDPGVVVQTYDWTPRTGLQCWDCQTNYVVVEEDMQYEIVGFDGNCYDTTSVTIIFDATVAIYVPNAFTPNGDGENDVFRVYGEGISKFRMKVFNRWGELMFESSDQMDGWDGTFQGKPMNPGVYVYYVDIEFITGQAPPEYFEYSKGSVTLIR